MAALPMATRLSPFATFDQDIDIIEIKIDFSACFPAELPPKATLFRLTAKSRFSAIL